MAGSPYPFAYLRDTRLAGHATGAVAAWLWQPDGRRILWANPVAAAALGAASPAELTRRQFDPDDPMAGQIVHLAETLPASGSPRLAALDLTANGSGRQRMCLCSKLTLDDATTAILAVATESGGSALPLDERVRRLLTDTDAAVAAFAPDGNLVHATGAAAERMGGLTTLASLAAGLVGEAALGKGHAEGRTPVGILRLDRIGRDGTAVLLATFPAQPEAPAPAPREAKPQPPAPIPEQPAERRPPLRFVWQTDPDGRFTIDSDAFAALIGPQSAAILGQPWIDIARKLDLDPEEQISRAVDSRETWSGIAVSWPVDGTDERIIVEMSGLPMFDRERRFLGYRGFGVCRDAERFTARTRADAGPASADIVPFRSAATAEAAPMLSAIEHTAFRELARELSARLKGRRADITGGGAAPESEAPAAETAQSSAPTPIPEAEDAPAPALPPHEGTRDLIDRAIVPIASEQPDGDAELRRARTRVRELQSIVDISTEGVVFVDDEGAVVRLNHRAEALFGCGSDTVKGRPLTELLAPESRPAAAADFAALVRDADACRTGREVSSLPRDNGSVPLFMRLGRIATEQPMFCAVFRDISGWKRTEQDLLAAKRQAEQASQAKSDFLAKISHEIRTPLNAIIGFSEVMMEERLGAIENERYRAYLKDIHASGEHLVALLNDLLDLSKIEAGKLELTFSKVDLNELTQQCVALMQPQANRGRVIIRTSLAPGLPPIVADARSVRQILLNLLSNSIKFTGAGGQVIVSTALTDGKEGVLRVRDTGIGMSEKEIETALEPFRQIETSARGGSGGTGLGLPLTKALAEANRANFAIKSNVNVGTLVEVAFPAARRPER